MGSENPPTESDESDDFLPERDRPFEAERVFDAPWQARAFAVAVAMAEEEEYPWDAFQSRLATEVERARAGSDTDPSQRGTRTAVEASPRAETETAEATYYEQWLAALTRLLVDSGTLTTEEIATRTREFAAGERTAEEWIEGERDHVHGDGHDGPSGQPPR